MIKAVFPGSFDPPTLGHLSIIKRASCIFDEIHVVIANNENKICLFSKQERADLFFENVKQFQNVSIHVWDGLVVDYAKKINSKILLRGVRNSLDFSYEFDLSVLNRAISDEIETFFIPSEPRYFMLRSASIKELAKHHCNISNFVPQNVALALQKKF